MQQGRLSIAAGDEADTARIAGAVARVSRTVDVRALQLSGVSLYVGVTGTATIDPSTGTGSVSFGPSFSLSFGGTAHP